MKVPCGSKHVAIFSVILKYKHLRKNFEKRYAGHVARMVHRIGIYTSLVGKPKGRDLLGRPRRRWDYNIKMDLQEVAWGGMD